ncbi:Bug family tripartite tricarboxylate transporter substrate binding protein [Hydrogenophaga palleronii]|uniref:Bug family tripartite tricarboxylate transporter substrate binding protein n=1 Tax=Hydrogenophaga palleronii TaxID=65655 RepID=UPI000824D362|nr:tripartite tricarboxylate transporter substrate binding protein [Hydrogenophaga palleronii]
MNLFSLASRRLRAAAWLASGLALAGLHATGAAAEYPAKPISVVVPLAPGGMGDAMARIVAEALQPMGQPIVVEFKPGASTMIATQYVARAPADGYTLLLTYTPFIMNPLLYPKPRYDAIKSFVPVAQLTNNEVVFIASAGTGIESWADYVKYAKSGPGALSFGTTGSGSLTHVYSKILEEHLGVTLLGVPYKGETPTINDIMGGSLASTTISKGTYRSLVSLGKFRAVAVAGDQRMPDAPNIPTLKELGVPSLMSWFGVFAPAGTPPDVVAKLVTHLNRALRDPAVKARIDKLGASTVESSSELFTQKLEQENRFWKEAVTKYRITAD